MSRKPSSGKSRSSRDDDLLWLETYFIVFPHGRRPSLSQVEHALAEAGPRLQLENLAADEHGLFASVLVQSPEDHAAVEVSYEMGDAVIEQNLEWAKHFQKQLSPKRLQLLVAADARLDVAHFERVRSAASSESPEDEPTGPRCHADFVDELPDRGEDSSEDDDEIDAFDPTCLLTVVDSLKKLTRGLAFDPASGEFM